ncbi:MAG: LysM peptidoglycan-binding domain-containing protein [Chloroflexi bacterium]|nr:LysM peptidoglycan-binding domain-containing protein [Chloroflexota bacterium]
MIECSACGAELTAHETRCPICGKPTAYYHRQRRCLNCGAPASEKAVTCMMCGQPVDSLPLKTSIFSGSWIGIGLGVLIIVAIVIGVTRYQGNLIANADAVAQATSPIATPIHLPADTPTPTVTDTPAPTATLSPTVTPTPYIHIVQAGENPSFIADQYGVAVEELMKLNNIDDVSSLQVGQELLIPSGASAAPSVESAEAGPPITYVVQPDDTLLGIAIDHETTIEAIYAANPDTSLDLIFPGQEIIVPLSPPTPTPTPTIPPTPTATPTPPYSTPDLLSPTANQVVNEPSLFFNWTATGLLAPDEFYVIQLTWANGVQTEVWLKNSSWRITTDQRPANGLITWTVTVMRQTGNKPDGFPTGIGLTTPAEPRTVEWR